jgi:hypothetical protein
MSHGREATDATTTRTTRRTRDAAPEDFLSAASPALEGINCLAPSHSFASPRPPARTHETKRFPGCTNSHSSKQT